MSLNDYIGEIASGAGGFVLGGTVGYLAGSRARKRKSSKRKTSKRSNIRKRARKHKQKHPYTAGKRKDTSRRRIRYTKNNQPYVIMANGRARFIKKSGVRSARKRKGGRY
jgi:hypothetical protein